MFDLKLNDSTLRDLSNNDMRILNYIYQHPLDVCSMDIKAFCSAIPCSASSIVRFCKKIGFSGFPELKYYLIHNVADQSDHTSTSSKNFPELTRKLTTDVKGSLSLVGSEELYRTAKVLTNDYPVFVFMPGGITDNLAKYFVKLLMSKGRQNIYQLPSSNMTKHKISTLSPDSIMVFISSSGKWAKTIELATLAKLRGLCVISFSPYSDNELAKVSDYSLRFFSESRSKDSAEYTSRLPIFFIINALIEYYSTIKEGAAHD